MLGKVSLCISLKDVLLDWQRVWHSIEVTNPN